jgi:hypothetical protein
VVAWNYRRTNLSTGGDYARHLNRAIYLAFGVNLRGLKEVLGMWAAGAEGAKFWLSVVTELKSRGFADIYIACVDGRTREFIYTEILLRLGLNDDPSHALVILQSIVGNFSRYVIPYSVCQMSILYF